MTPERFHRIQTVLTTRQPDLTVCLEQVYKPHNVSAIIRTADAIGIPEVHAIWPHVKMKTTASSAAGSHSWVRLTTHPTTETAVEYLKQQNMQVLVAHSGATAVDFREIDYTRPTCILLGQEKRGVSKEAIALADKMITIPILGMVESLNVSVAAAVVLYEAQRQRATAKLYDSPAYQLSTVELQRMLFEGGYPVLARVAKRKNLPPPKINEQGKLDACEDWWQAIRTTKLKKPYPFSDPE